MKLLIKVNERNIGDRIRLVDILDYVYELDGEDKWWIEGSTGVVMIDDETEFDSLKSTFRMYGFEPERYECIY